MVYVEKGGEIIPKITGVDEGARKPGAKPIEFVTHCPACGTALTRIPGEAAWQCPDKYGCPPHIIGRLEHFVGRRMMNIDGIGEENCAMLYNAGLVKDIADFYNLKPEQLESLDRLGKRSAERIMKGIEASKSVPFDRVRYALSIPFVGETLSRKIARQVRGLDRLMELTPEQLTALEDVGPKIAESIVEFFAYEPNRAIIERLKAAGVQTSLPEEEPGETSDRLAGKTIVISGVFAKHSREEYKEMIEKNGGKNSGSISKKTSFVLAGDNMGPAKLEKAKSLGVAILNEDEFLAMLEGEGE
ncbi:MAG: hypothetical protein K2H83_00445 [Duncaniella sp.]|nr:hypothetical protein [Duncaniella sp.]